MGSRQIGGSADSVANKLINRNVPMYKSCEVRRPCQAQRRQRFEKAQWWGLIFCA